jgi:hypothetical protein
LPERVGFFHVFSCRGRSGGASRACRGRFSRALPFYVKNASSSIYRKGKKRKTENGY